MTKGEVTSTIFVSALPNFPSLFFSRRLFFPFPASYSVVRPKQLFPFLLCRLMYMYEGKKKKKITIRRERRVMVRARGEGRSGNRMGNRCWRVGEKMLKYPTGRERRKGVEGVEEEWKGWRTDNEGCRELLIDGEKRGKRGC